MTASHKCPTINWPAVMISGHEMPKFATMTMTIPSKALDVPNELGL
jgi:hypothetical protein